MTKLLLGMIICCLIMACEAPKSPPQLEAVTPYLPPNQQVMEPFPYDLDTPSRSFELPAP